MRIAALVLVLAGCSPSEEGAPAMRVEIIGAPGPGDGQLATPRAVAWDPAGRIYVSDKSARIQRFDVSGRFVRGWSTPANELGAPTGLALTPAGDLLVADAHYHRILRYTPEGELAGQFGSEGDGPGEFLYPVGIAVAKDGTIFVSEYGGNDRIQVFTAEWRPLRQWGRYGEEQGEFKRPQALALSGDRLYVADAANHRIQVFTLEGDFVSSWGGVRYPYSAAVDPEGRILVAEYGRNCVSCFRPDGTLVARIGRAGSEPGELHTPWDAVPAGDRVLVADSGNHRVQAWPRSAWEGR